MNKTNLHHPPEGWPPEAQSLYREYEAVLWREITLPRRHLLWLRPFFWFQARKHLAFNEIPREALDEYLQTLQGGTRRWRFLWALSRWVQFLQRKKQLLIPAEPELPGDLPKNLKRRKRRFPLAPPPSWPERAQQRYQQYRDHLRQRLRNPRHYLLHLHHFFRAQIQQGFDFHEVPTRLLTSYLEGLKVGVRDPFLSALSSWLRFLYNRKELLLPLHEKLAEYRVNVRTCRPILSLEQVQQVLEQPNPEDLEGLRDRTFLEVAYATGLRLGELLELELGDLDLGLGLVQVRNPKNNRARNVPLTGWARHYLQRYLSEARSQWASPLSLNALWLNSQGRCWNRDQVFRRLKRYQWRQSLGFGFSMHLLRHACATHLLRAGAPLRHVQEILGHQDLNSTRIYTHVTPTDLQAQHRRFHPRFQPPFPQ